MISSLVSTIIPVYNRPQVLQEAVQSVLNQTYRPIEIIIVDDGSTDETLQITDKLAVDHPEIIKVLHIPNSGPGMAREAGRLIAKGEFIQYLDSDDLLLHNKFTYQVSKLKKNPECDVAYGKTRFNIVGETLTDEAWKRTGEKIYYMFPSFLLSRWWDTSTPLYRAALLKTVGSWLNLVNEEDWEYDCRVASLGTKLCFVDEFVSETRIVNDGLHLSIAGSSCPKKLASRATAHSEIYKHAKTANISVDTPEMQHFARALFLLSRQCGAAGLAKESEQLFELAKQASTPQRAQGIDFRLYKRLASIIGWSAMGKISCWAHRLRK